MAGPGCPRSRRTRAPPGQSQRRASGARTQQPRPEPEQRPRQHAWACLLRPPWRRLRSRAGAPTAERPRRWPALPMRRRPRGRPPSARATAAQQRRARTAARRPTTGLARLARAPAALAAGRSAAPPSPTPLLAPAHMQVGHVRPPLAVLPSHRVQLAPMACRALAATLRCIHCSLSAAAPFCAPWRSPWERQPAARKSLCCLKEPQS